MPGGAAPVVQSRGGRADFDFGFRDTHRSARSRSRLAERYLVPNARRRRSRCHRAHDWPTNRLKSRFRVQEAECRTHAREVRSTRITIKEVINPALTKGRGFVSESAAVSCGGAPLDIVSRYIERQCGTASSPP